MAAVIGVNVSVLIDASVSLVTEKTATVVPLIVTRSPMFSSVRNLVPAPVSVAEPADVVTVPVRAVKWRDWKLHYVWQEEPGTPVQQTMKLFNLRTGPKEETDVKDFNPWVLSVIDGIVRNFWTTVDKYPLIPVGTPDPYSPPGR